MARKTNWPAEVKARALELYAEHGARCAARLLADEGHAVPFATIHSWARAEGLPTRANENRKADVEATRLTIEQRKQALADGLLSDAERLRNQLFGKTTVFNFGGKDNDFNSKEIDEPTFADKTKIATAIAIFIDKVQLLTGEATARTESISAGPGDRVTKVQSIRDDLAERRALRAG